MKRAYAVVNFTTSSGVRLSAGEPPIVPRMPDIDFMSVIVSKILKNSAKVLLFLTKILILREY
jgi:hypothetical protein